MKVHGAVIIEQGVTFANNSDAPATAIFFPEHADNFDVARSKRQSAFLRSARHCGIFEKYPPRPNSLEGISHLLRRKKFWTE